MLLVAAFTLHGGPGDAQLLGRGSGLPSADLPGGAGRIPLPGVGDTLRGVERRAGALTDAAMGEARRLRRDLLVRRNPGVLETDPHGEAVIRGQVLALAPDAETLQRLRTEGFIVRAAEDDGLDLGLVVLEAPPGVSAREAVRRLRRLDPEGRYDFNHVYLEAGAMQAGGGGGPAIGGAGPIGLIDGGVDPGHPALRRARIEQRPFAPGGLSHHPHGAAVASLLVGEDGRFRGAAPGAALYVADVYGPTPAGGSAQSIGRALGWMVQVRAPVINISLVGPPNLALEAAIAAVQRRGHLVVAAVGNDGPAAPPLYPAAYPGVVGVTAVDTRGRVLPEAGRGEHVDFAGPGADMAAAGGRGFVAVRGTSFAAPIVAARLSRTLTAPDPRAAAQAVASLTKEAKDLGSPGPDRTYGRGLVGADLIVRPASVGATGVLAGR